MNDSRSVPIRLRPLLQNNQWNTFEDVINERRTTLVTQILKCEPNMLQKLQGQVQELDYFLALKASLIAEEKAK
tara:strand:+ start:3307 stop:3528 length:222 start_codon:yes stop_codon:yes gene_type:complete